MSDNAFLHRIEFFLDIVNVDGKPEWVMFSIQLLLCHFNTTFLLRASLPKESSQEVLEKLIHIYYFFIHWHTKSHRIMAVCKVNNWWYHHTLMSWKCSDLYQLCADIWQIGLNIQSVRSLLFRWDIIIGARQMVHSISEIMRTFNISWSTVSYVDWEKWMEGITISCEQCSGQVWAFYDHSQRCQAKIVCSNRQMTLVQILFNGGGTRCISSKSVQCFSIPMRYGNRRPTRLPLFTP